MNWSNGSSFVIVETVFPVASTSRVELFYTSLVGISAIQFITPSGSIT